MTSGLLLTRCSSRLISCSAFVKLVLATDADAIVSRSNCLSLSRSKGLFLCFLVLSLLNSEELDSGDELGAGLRGLEEDDKGG